MNKTLISSMLIALVAVATPVMADEKTLEQRVLDLEANAPSLPAGLFINGEVEMYYDPDTYTSDIDSRAEIITGLQSDIDAGPINWAGGSARFDSHYSLDTTLNNTIVEKQMGLGFGENARLYIGETDAQRLGFAKTPKIGVPLIITEANSRIDHNEKVVLTFGGWDNNNEFDFDTHSINRDLPVGASLGYDANTEMLYAGVTMNLMGYAEVSYMQIGDKDDAFGSNNQQGYAIGTSLYRWDIPVVLGVEMWDDKDTGAFTKENRMDYGVMYGLTDEVQLGYHRVEHDDIGTSGDYLSAVYTQGPVEMGVYYHMTESQNLGTGAITENDDSLKASIKYKF